jgi:hypothetical protein
MSKYVVICQADGCEAENTDWEDSDGTYWFDCINCGMSNEVVYDGSK